MEQLDLISVSQLIHLSDWARSLIHRYSNYQQV